MVTQQYFTMAWISVAAARICLGCLRMLKYRKDKDALLNYLNGHGDYFNSVDGGTVRAVAELLQSKKMLSRSVKRKELEGEEDVRLKRRMKYCGRSWHAMNRLIEKDDAAASSFVTSYLSPA